MDITDNSKLMSIDDHAFEHTAVTDFAMPKDLVEIGTAAFNGAKLDTLIVNDSGDWKKCLCRLWSGEDDEAGVPG